ncbi:MAG: rRNA pseudouridine synthase [Candidatus Magasanikbacteria bacterium CG10_big_fil_rev_8_21_14_0_10_36_16]|uniref:Pseudouridine synthase n=1 Tax=Candidatus Magasanikbacteria bacterium CG10_big_fil_rev_8_21_14_0_10_36_16 TaxID=1974645 RepID=A0A2H0TYC2_9BACT|nr:MAG: rRNA pseudouridine synthase [Candidatus Magasanikbacteria bacterium CG10_big_fil_rev_8_21_14_0_10_36_16]
MLVRLQKHMSNIGICSRRKAEELILAKKVKVNGELVTEMGVKVDPEKDKVEVLSEKYFVSKKSAENFDNKKIYIALNKPVGYITSASSEQGESVLDLLTENNCMAKGRKLETRVYPVGRLDKDSEGLVLLTNDGELTNEITHPRYEHEKEYEITIDGFLDADSRKILTTGMKITSGYVQGIKIVKEFKKGRNTIVTAILTEGKNRQVRKMFGNIGYRVMTLRRSRINKLTLGVMPVGKWKYVSRDKIV